MHATPRRPSSANAAPAWRAAPLLVAMLLAGCASTPRPVAPAGSWPDRDGPDANPPADLARVPDAEPRSEPIRPGGPNKPYEVLGHEYVPITQDRGFTERGLASWYGRKFQGKRTSSGELYNMYAMTAAHPTLPIPSYARIRNPANRREVVVRINDRGPFHSGRIVDLSYTAALKLDLLRGVAPVELERITFEDIRTGAWRRTPGSDPAGEPVRVAVRESAPAAAPAAVVVPADVVVATAVSALPALPGPAEAAPAPPGDAPVAGLPGVDAPGARAHTAPARGFWVQLGAFRQRDGAESFQRRVVAEMDWLVPLVAVFGEAQWFRLQAGPYPSRDEARGTAERIRETLQLVPVIVERR